MTATQPQMMPICLALNSTAIPNIKNAILQRFSSTAFEVAPNNSAVWLRGQDRTHHSIDPELGLWLQDWQLNSLQGISCFHTRYRGCGVTFEDSWSGWLLAPRLASQEPLVVLHLDDHRDLMAPLLAQNTTGELFNPVAQSVFEVGSQTDWALAIQTGVINIGTWLSALVLARITEGKITHIRHLHPIGGSSSACPLSQVDAEFPQNDLFPNHRFGQLRLQAKPATDAGSTFLASESLKEVMHDLPEGSIILHIDLDYFQNDFNGNLASSTIDDISALDQRCADVLSTVLTCVDDLGREIVDAAIATSPGFCAARRWHLMVDALTKSFQEWRNRRSGRGDNDDG